MKSSKNIQVLQKDETALLKLYVRNLGVDLVGIANLELLKGMPVGVALNSVSLLRGYRYAIVMGIQLGKLGKNASSNDANLFLEKAALDVLTYLEGKGYPALIVHTEDEFDPINRLGLLSLKVLAKGAGLGWQGRSLLVISPLYGPIHRLIAVLTNMDLQSDQPILNQCGNCTSCIDNCPHDALRFVAFEDHPKKREDVLVISACGGDEGCMICLMVCPWSKQQPQPYHKIKH